MALQSFSALLFLVVCATVCRAFPTETSTQTSLIVKRGHSNDTLPIGKCYKLGPEIPSTVELRQTGDGFGSKYLLVRYSNENCENDNSVSSPVPLIPNEPVSLNERWPIISFNVGNQTVQPLNITFSYEDTHLKTFTYRDPCVNLCTVDEMTCNYPMSLGIRTTDGKEAKNSPEVHLFGKPDCQDESIIIDTNGGSDNVGDGANLSNFTRKHKSSVVKSFLVTLDKMQ